MSDTDIDALAAEYVLGTLDAGERAQTQAMLTVDQALGAKVRIWERRLSELHLMVEPIDPDEEIWERILAKMPLVAPPPPEPLAEPAVVPALPVAEHPAPPNPAAPQSLEALAAALSAQEAANTADIFADTVPAVAQPHATSSGAGEAEAKTETEPETEAEAEAEAEAKKETSATEAATIEIRETEVSAADQVSVERPKELGAAIDEVVAAIRAAEPPPIPPAVEEEPTPSGVFDDMPEPTPATPLAPFPSSFTASKPSQTPLTPSPPSTLSVPAPPPVAPVGPALTIRPERRPRPAPPPKSRWLSRTIATLLTLVLLALAALVAAWRFVPDQVPPSLRPVEVLRSMGIPMPVSARSAPVRRPAPPESRYEE